MATLCDSLQLKMHIGVCDGRLLVPASVTEDRVASSIFDHLRRLGGSNELRVPSIEKLRCWFDAADWQVEYIAPYSIGSPPGEL
jgi:hypothetical protein